MVDSCDITVVWINFMFKYKNNCFQHCHYLSAHSFEKARLVIPHLHLHLHFHLQLRYVVLLIAKLIFRRCSWQIVSLSFRCRYFLYFLKRQWLKTKVNKTNNKTKAIHKTTTVNRLLRSLFLSLSLSLTFMPVRLAGWLAFVCLIIQTKFYQAILLLWRNLLRIM